MTDFPLFQAGLLAMKGLAFSRANFEQRIGTPEIERCSFCGNDGLFLWIMCDDVGEVDFFSGFVLKGERTNLAPVVRQDPDNPEEPDRYYRGCLDCLCEGRFVVWHHTECGWLLPEWSSFKPTGAERPEGIRPEVVEELLRTPGFRSWQDDFWLLHCDGFMAYLGEWSQQDFSDNASSGDGKALFARVVQGADFQQKGWDDLTETESNFHLFRCPTCGVLRSCVIS